MILIDLVEDISAGAADGTQSFFQLNIRAINNMQTDCTFNGDTLHPEGLCIAKLEEIRYKLYNNSTIKTALGTEKIYPRGKQGRIIPLGMDENDYAYVYSQRFFRNNEVTYS